MNIETVAKGLECCSNCLGYEDCENCPYYQSIRCNVKLMQDALVIIDELQAKNEKLTKERNAHSLAGIIISKKDERLRKQNEELRINLEQQKAYNENLKKEISYLRDRLTEEMEHAVDMEGNNEVQE